MCARSAFCAGAAAVLVLVLSTANAQPMPGEEFIWIDLGENNEGLLLAQSEQQDGVTEPAVKADVDCRENPWPYDGPGGNHIYFRIDDGYLKGGDTEVWIVMEYFDSAVANEIDCQYDSDGAGAVLGAFRGAGDGAFDAFHPGNSEEWLIHVWHIEDGRFENRGNGSDFRLSSHGAGPIWINRVWFSLVEPPENFNPEMPFGFSFAVSPSGKTPDAWARLKATF